MRTGRLLRLAALLDRVPAEQFDENTWASKHPTKPIARVAGALGWATTIIPDLALRPFEDGSGWVQHVPTGAQDVEAAQNAFGLPHWRAVQVFQGDPERTAPEIAEEIRTMVRLYRQESFA